MQTLRIQLKDVQPNCVELRYWVEPQTTYESQFLNIAQIADLVQEANLNYYRQPRGLRERGQKLFCWLDGEGRWLSRAIKDCNQDGLILAIATPEKLAHLPWELLHDGTSFLVEGVNPVVVPVRWIEGKTPPPPTLEARPLQVLFMATSPETVEPVLDFEAEEARILAQTQEMAVQVRVEESGCVAELGKLWARYPHPFDIFHLTGHGAIQGQAPYHPYFITETETGDRHDAFAPELAEVFRHRWPQLIFLSGCRTGQAGNEGAVLSMAETLIQQGARAVLGWGLPVLETTATAAAAHLYQKLAEGYSLSQGLGSTYHYLLKEKLEDWHLLRLYVRGDCPGALVEPPGDYHWQPPQLPQEQFFDPLTQEVRVATREEFVGRRRYLQRYLRALKGGKFLGVVIYGIGGVGKSTVAARLLERMPEYEPIFIYRGLDEAKLINQLSRQCTNETGVEILQGKLSLMQRLTKFLQMGLNSQKQQLMFVLDDFEANLELRADGKAVLKPEVVEVVRGLLDAIAQSRGPHRVIITCRYDFTLPNSTLNRRLYREPLAALRGADLRKKCQRLRSFQPDSEVDANLQERAKNAADGNPRLLEWLNQILLTRSVAISEIITKMQETETKFRADILAEELLNQQDKDLRKLLRLGLVFHVPVPRAAFTEICSKIRNLETHITRAISLGLLESIQSTPADGELLRVPRLLPLPLPENDEPLHRQAAEILYQIWWEKSETSIEERLMEIHRLALVGKTGEIPANIAERLTPKWHNKSRFREAVKMCQDTLTVIEDYRIVHQLGRSEQKLGEVEKATKYYQQALKLCPLEDEREKGAIVHNLASLKEEQGEIEEAISLYSQSLELFGHIGEVQGKGATSHCLAIIKTKQGKIEEAIFLYNQLMELNESLNDDVEGKAATLHQLAGIKVNQGEIEEAISLYTQSLKLNERIGNLQGKAATLHCLAIIKASQGEIEEASSLYTQSMELNEQIGNGQGKAVTLHQLAGIKVNQGEINEAISLYTQSLKLNEQIGNRQGEAATLHQLAGIKVNQREIEEAISLYTQSLEINEGIGYLQGKAATLVMLGQLLASRGDFTTALQYMHQSLEVFERLGSPEAEQVRTIIVEIQKRAEE